MALDPAPVPPVAHRPVILIVGGGYVGLYTALRLQKKLARGRAEIVVVDPQPPMTYQRFPPPPPCAYPPSPPGGGPGRGDPGPGGPPRPPPRRPCRVTPGGPPALQHG